MRSEDWDTVRWHRAVAREPDNVHGERCLRCGGVDSGQGRGLGQSISHPLVDGVRLAQRALRGWDAVGDAPVALAQTPQLTADLLRAKISAQAHPLPPPLERGWVYSGGVLGSGPPTLLYWASRNLGHSSRSWPGTSSLPTYVLHLLNTHVS